LNYSIKIIKIEQIEHTIYTIVLSLTIAYRYVSACHSIKFT